MEEQRVKELVHAAVTREGLPIQGWSQGEDGPEAELGRARMVEDDPSNGLLQGDEGKLTASVVGAPEHRNVQVAYFLQIDEMDMPTQVEATQFEPI